MDYKDKLNRLDGNEMRVLFHLVRRKSFPKIDKETHLKNYETGIPESTGRARQTMIFKKLEIEGDKYKKRDNLIKQYRNIILAMFGDDEDKASNWIQTEDWPPPKEQPKESKKETPVRTPEELTWARKVLGPMVDDACRINGVDSVKVAKQWEEFSKRQSPNPPKK